MKLFSSITAWRGKSKGARSLSLLAFTLAIGAIHLDGRRLVEVPDWYR